MARRRKNSGGNSNGATLGFERQLWKAANTLRGNMDAAEYKHVVLGLIFLKHISDAFEQHRAKLLQEPYANPEDPDESWRRTSSGYRRKLAGRTSNHGPRISPLASCANCRPKPLGWTKLFG